MVTCLNFLSASFCFVCLRLIKHYAEWLSGMLNEIQDQELEKIALNQQTATGTLYMHGDLIVALSAFNATEAFADKGTRVCLQK